MDLGVEQEKTLKSQRMNYGLFARLLFFMMDVFYGKKRTLVKFRILELLARIPYQAWEQGAYCDITRKYENTGRAYKIHQFLKKTREQQDNELWHLLILEELIQNMNIKENYIYHGIFPQLAAFMYYIASWLIYKINPRISFTFNAWFEDHAEHEYMLFTKENPQFDQMEFDSTFKSVYGDYKTYGDVFRRIGVDERKHKKESLEYLEHFDLPTI
ncbi:MAG: hypothetical protein KAQ98_09985 [Bacteriovoracaceae bacterium]|nr:hypothetical protein [Bacteriovoracaceae bacterium]